MDFTKYISLNLFSLNAYFLLSLILFVFFIQRRINCIIINLETFFSLYSFCMYVSIFLLVLFIIEKFLCNKQKIKMYFAIKNKDLKRIYLLFFYTGFYFIIFNLVIFCLTMLFLTKL